MQNVWASRDSPLLPKSVHSSDTISVYRLLKEKDRDGTYLIRGGSHAGSEKVLSVWHIDRCRHYRLFKDEQVIRFRL